MADTEQTPDFVHEPDGKRYVLLLDGQRIAVSTYSDHLRQRTFMHTEVDPDFGGRGYATRLVRAALDDCRQSGYTIVARCPIVAAFVAKHSEYQDLVAR